MEKARGKMTLLNFLAESQNNFPKSPELRAQFERTAQNLCRQLEQQHSVRLEERHLKGLAVKLAKYCAKRQWNFAALSGELATLADAISSKPEVLCDPTLTLAKIIALHYAWNRQAQAAMRRELLANPSADAPPAMMARSAKGDYQLVECLTQRHLQEETAALGHCVGGSHLEHYRDKLARGAARIFSLRTSRGVPVATIEYDTGAEAITQIQGASLAINGREPFFRALCQTIHALTLQLPVGPIRGLPRIKGKSLTKDGTFISIAPTNMADILFGTLIVDNTTPLPLLRQLSASPRLTLDVSALDLLRLPARINCALSSSKKSFNAPQLESVGNIDALAAISFSIPGLQTAGHILACRAKSFNAPQLRWAGYIDAGLAISFSIPQLREAGNIFVDSVLSFTAPQLKTADTIHAEAATSFSAPVLESCLNIHTDGLRSFNAPQLRVAGNIHAGAATSFNIPQLLTAGDIHAGSAASFSAPQLRGANSLHADTATSFSAPRLRNAETIYARSATHFSAPQLRISGNLYTACVTNAGERPDAKRRLLVSRNPFDS
jgi:hypothetical protein